MDELDTLLDDHPSWGPEQKAAAVRTAGAKFGPADEARMLSEARARLTALAELLGETRIASHGFYYEPAYWAIEARTVRAPHTVYYLTFEPFEGRLVSLGQNDPALRK